MHIFDVLGPVMIGPSSSHTAGVVRIGNVARRILGRTPNHACIQFHGSLAKTYRGHGSDKAIVAGLMGFAPDDTRIRDSLSLANERGFAFEIATVELENVHPNTVLISAELSDERGDNHIAMQAASVGGGNILVQEINGIEVSFDGYYDTLVVIHQDQPGAISLATSVLAVAQINIAGMKVYRAQKGGRAIMVIEADGQLDKKLVSTLSNLPLIEQVTVLKGVSHDYLH